MNNSSKLAVTVLVLAALSLGFFWKTDKKTTEVELNSTTNFKQTASIKTEVGSKHVTRISLNQDEIIPIIGEITSNAGSIAMAITNKTSTGQTVYLLINSPGGSVLDGALIVSAIQSAKTPVYTICLQICASMAAIIHQYGKERFMVDRSVLMFHNAAGNLQGSVPQMMTRLNFLNRYVDKMFYEIATRAGLTLEQFHDMFSNESWLDAEDSVNNKFADKIVNVDLQLAPQIGPVGDFNKNLNFNFMMDKNESN